MRHYNPTLIREQQLEFGDVVIVDYYGYIPGDPHFVEEMERYCGKQAKVCEVENLSGVYVYRLDIDQMRYYRSSNMLLPACDHKTPCSRCYKLYCEKR